MNSFLFGDKSPKNEWKDILSMNAVVQLWARNKQVYRFDPDFARELSKTDGLQLYPDMLRRMPYSTFYLDFEGIPEFAPFDGMFAHVEVKENCDVLLLGHRVIGKLYYTCASNLQENVRQYDQGVPFYDFSRDKFRFQQTVPLSKIAKEDYGNKILSNQSFPDIWMFFVQTLMYLSSKEPDIGENPQTKKTYRPSTRIRNKYSEVRKWDIGVRYGNAIRLSQQDNGENDILFSDTEHTEHPDSTHLHTRKPPRPHSRRAHWQLYWTGKGRKTPEMKWIAPTFVGPRESISAVIHTVKK